MSWLLREKTDGRRTAGYLVYLSGGLVAVGAMIALRHMAVSGAKPARRTFRDRASDISPITQPASIMAAVEVAAKPAAADARSYRMEKLRPPRHPASPPDDSVPAGFNAIDAALEGSAGAGSGAQGNPAAGGERYAELAPAFFPQTIRRSPGQAATPGAELLGYRDPAADVSFGGAERLAPDLASSVPAYFLPRGTLLWVYLLTTVDTGNPSAVLQFGAAKNSFFERRCQLPFGTRFLGKLSGRAGRDRLNLTADTILYPDGTEFPLSASAVEADENGISIRPGVAAYFYPPPSWVQVAPYFSDFFTGAMGLLESRAQQQLSIGVGGVSVQTGTNSDLRAPLYQAGAQAVQDFTQARLKELEQRYASYYLVPAGTACWLQLDQDFFGKADVGKRARPAETPPQQESETSIRPGPSTHVQN